MSTTTSSSSIPTTTTTTTTNTTTNLIPDQSTLKKLKVPELKDLLSTYSLPLSGKKEDLVQRLIDHSTSTTSSSATLHPELDFDPEELALPTTATTMKKQPPTLASPVNPSPPTVVSPIKPPLSPSKTTALPPPSPTGTSTSKTTPDSDVIVKPSGFKFTKLSFGDSNSPTNSSQATPTKNHPLPAKPTSAATPLASSSSKKPTTPGSATTTQTTHTSDDLEKRKQRAARFGLPLSEDVKRADRAKRFGESLSTPAKKVASLPSESSAVASGSGSASASKRDQNAVSATPSAKPSLTIDPETLKRRQERFGSIGSNEKMSPLALSDEERKRKRAEKYGTSSASPISAEAPGSPEKKIKV